MKEGSDRQEGLDVICPCCQTRLTLDRASGEVLYEDRPKKRGMSWEQALAADGECKSAAEQLFERGIDRERNADELLEKKFREAMKRADKSDSPPPRIFDLD